MTRNKKTHCLEALRMRILSQDIAPGSDLDEASLCETYGISRTPLREVLHRLAGEGYLRLEENRGAKVASMDLGVMRTFFQTAPLVYATIARLAAENRTVAQLDGLKDTQHRFRQATTAGNADEAALLNHRFHEQIGEMAHNPYLTPSLKRMLIDHTRLSQTFYRPASADERGLVAKATEQHDGMIVAIEARESTIAVDLTLQHWDLSRDRLERFVRPDPLPLDVISLKEASRAV
ncbi:MAG: GntR family transcriptional regulator [Paracoccaceae bacterium]